MKTIEAGALRPCLLESPARTLRAEVVLPFFAGELQTRFLLVVPEEGKPLATRDLPTGVVSRSLSFRRDPRVRMLAQVNWTKLWHFDPWWLLRDRPGVSPAVRKALAATNIAGRELPGGRIEMLWFDYALRGVAAARVGGKRVSRRRLLAMLPEMHAAPTE